MDLPWLPIGLSSVTASFVLVHNTPQYSVSASYVKTFLALETLQILLGLLWQAIIYPKFFSPIRHLPQPKVGLDSHPHDVPNLCLIAGWLVFQRATQEDIRRANWRATQRLD